jgi:peptide/nickel transport system substrate-binding protein
MEQGSWSRVLHQRASRRRALAVTSGVAGAAAFLAACGGGDKVSESDKSSLVSTPVDTLKTAKRGGTMKGRTFADPPTLDILSANNPWGATGLCVYNTLVLAKPGYLKPAEGEIAPDLAESWETSPDGLQLTLKLRQGVKFHNKPPVSGRGMDMDDVLFSWNRFASKYSGRVNLVNAVNPDAPILSVTASDPKTIIVKLKEPVVYALALFIGGNGSGVYIIPKETDSTLDLRGDEIGTGAWYLSNYNPSVSFTLKRNPDFYDKDWALVDQIDLPIVTEYATALAQFKAGNIYNMYGTNLAIKAEDVLTTKREEPRISIYQSDIAAAGATQSFGWLPAGKSPFLDERVRQAVSMAIDRDLYLEAALNVAGFRDEGLPVQTRWSSSLAATNEGWWLDPQSKDFGPNAKYYQHNVAEAKKLLAAAGYPTGFATTSHAPGIEYPAAAFGVLTDGMIAEAGIMSTPHHLDYQKEYIPSYRDGHGQFEGWAYMSTAGATVPGGVAIGALAVEYWSKGGAAFHGFSVNGQNDQSGDPQVNAMIEKARVEPDTEKRRALVFDIQRYLAKAIYALSPPGAASGFVVAWPCLGNFRVYSGARAGGAEPGWWIDETKPPFKTS